MLVVVK